MTSPENYLVVFLRHGESEGNSQGVHQGQADFPLTPRGRAQAQALAQRWAAQGVTFDGIISSPLARAAQTALLVARALGFPEAQIQYDAVWQERDKGELTGLPFEQTAGTPPSSLFAPVGETGESLWEVYQRATEALRRLLQRPPGRYLVVSHGGILNWVLRAALSIPPQPYPHAPSFRLPNAAYVILQYAPARHQWAMFGLCHRLDDAIFPCQ